MLAVPKICWSEAVKLIVTPRLHCICICNCNATLQLQLQSQLYAIALHTVACQRVWMPGAKVNLEATRHLGVLGVNEKNSRRDYLCALISSGTYSRGQIDSLNGFCIKKSWRAKQVAESIKFGYLHLTEARATALPAFSSAHYWLHTFTFKVLQFERPIYLSCSCIGMT